VTTAAAPLVPPPANPATAARRAPTRRNTELLLLLLAMGITACYAAAVEYGATGHLGRFWLPPLLLTLVFLAAHLVVRFLTPYADPAILPAVALLNGIGVVFLHRVDLDPNLPDKGWQAHPNFLDYGAISFRQLIWTIAAILVATAALVIVRDHRVLSRYAYTLGLTGLVLMMIPAVLPASLSEVNGAKLWIRFGGFFQIQPGEFAKVLVLSFFAYYLVRKREVLSLASRRFLGIDFPRGRDIMPLIVVWAISLFVLVFEKDLGTSLLYFGMFVVTLYIATERVSWLIMGLLLFFGGATMAYFLGASVGGPFANFYQRVGIWLNPFGDPFDKGYQIVQSLLGLGTGGIFGSGPGTGYPDQIPAVYNDFVFAGIGEEIGLFGLTALLMMYLVIVERGLRAAIAVRDSFGKLMAGGLAFTLGLQVFVIVGGVTKLIPLTGQTTPFLSSGGSSLMANWLLVALLLRVSDASRRPIGGPAPGATPVKIAGLKTEVMR
jgi:cell division protein FtsW (lipid II flippase)